MNINLIFLLFGALITASCTNIGTTIQPAPTHEPRVLMSNTNPNPPEEAIKLIFIHHSTGGNWLANQQSNSLGGGLGQTLMENNYFVSATNYGWGPDGIGDRTDIGHWWEWFRGPDSEIYLGALYNENGTNFGDFGEYSRLESPPTGENEIILFKSCFPNSGLGGDPNAPIPAIDENPIRTKYAGDQAYTVANAKGIYIDLLEYFETRPDKLFIVITAPPLAQKGSNLEQAANARVLNTWLINQWLVEYPLNNVAVFDFYNVLTGPENHHHYTDGHIVHISSPDNFAFYPSSKSDSHPNQEGNQKATQEFVELLNIYYNRWKEN